jgi:hypothetical protein
VSGLKIAKSVSLDRATGVVSIDGEPFPFFLAREDVSVTVGDGHYSMSVVRLPVLVDLDGSITIDGAVPVAGEHQVPPAEPKGDEQ